MSVQLLSIVGAGTFGQVYKAVWRGTIVAAKVIPTLSTTNLRVIENELNVYK
jgi:serine/threonine protein kinase